MKLKVILALVALGLVAAVLFFLLKPEKMPTAISGKLDIYRDFESKYVSKRTVAVWLPDGYRQGMPCNVLYMHDGQNLFDATTTWNGQEWGIDETLQPLIDGHTLPMTIVVGVWSIDDDRYYDYFPQKITDYVKGDAQRKVDSEKITADRYLKFLTEELKPFIDGKYHPATDPEHTFIAGSSMGGLISLYALCEYPDVYGGAACLSTHVTLTPDIEDVEGNKPWGEAFRTYLDKKLPAPDTHKVYMDRGTETLDAFYADEQTRLDTLFADKGWTPKSFVSRVIEGAEHCERDWAPRVASFAKFLLLTPDNATPEETTP